jgi:RNA polymerase sigma factor (sigma-70 family)
MTVVEFNQNVDNHADGVYRFIYKNIRDQEKAKDVVQDAFEKLWINVQSVPCEKGKAYLFTTAYHSMIDLIRREKRRAGMEAANLREYGHEDQYTDIREVLDQAISQLPESQRSVLMLRDYEGYSYEEIGEITGLSEAQVKVYIYRARVFLKNKIGKMEVLI